MNKTLTINLGGYVFHIEENAYEILGKYINAIKSHFANPETRSEIISDVEARVAELFRAELGKIREVISEDDVNKVIGIMGNPEDFGGDADAESSDSSRPFANPSNYDYTSKSRRRIFRDPDDKVAGGVCSGVANYFGFDPLWLRLVWALSFFFFGFGIMLYIILWIIIPKAKTTADKLEMRGEPVNLQNIEKQVKEEMKDFEGRVKGFGEDAKNWGRSGPQSTIGRFFQDFILLVGQILGGFFRFIGKAIGIFLLILACILGVMFLGSVFGTMDLINVTINEQNFGLDIQEILNRIFVSDTDKYITATALITLALIPIISILYLAIRILFKVRKGIAMPWILTGLTILGILLLIIPFRNLRKDTKALYVAHDKVSVNMPVDTTFHVKNGKVTSMDIGMHSRFDTLYLESDPKSDMLLITGFSRNDGDIEFHGNWNILVDNETPVLVGLTNLNVIESLSDSTWIEVIRSAKGADNDDAERRAKAIDYGVSQRDNKIVVNGYFTLGENEKLRHQKLKVILHLGKGKTVFLNRNIKPLIYDIKNTTDTYDSDMLGHYWTMTAHGLTCPDFAGSRPEGMSDEEWEDGGGETTETEEIDLGNGKKEVRVKILG